MWHLNTGDCLVTTLACLIIILNLSPFLVLSQKISHELKLFLEVIYLIRTLFSLSQRWHLNTGLTVFHNTIPIGTTVGQYPFHWPMALSIYIEIPLKLVVTGQENVTFKYRWLLGDDIGMLDYNIEFIWKNKLIMLCQTFNILFIFFHIDVDIKDSLKIHVHI
jgi:hypothetical protein